MYPFPPPLHHAVKTSPSLFTPDIYYHPAPLAVRLRTYRQVFALRARLPACPLS